MRILRFGNERRKATSDYFYNMSALAFVGSVVVNVFEKQGELSFVLWGLALSVGLFIVGYIMKGGE